MKSVADELDLFTFGVRYYQWGRFNDAIDMFESFSRKFPGREVYNNIGLSNYQLAIRMLSACNESLLLRFKLPYVLDTETRGTKLRTGETVPSACLSDITFQKHLKEAISNFETAKGKDPSYLPARINISSALLIAGDYTKAMAVTEEALNIQPQNPDAKNNKAIALYLLGRANNIETADKALGILNDITSQDSSYSNAFYNIAAILSERKDENQNPPLEKGGLGGFESEAAITEARKLFLKTESTGIYADAVRKMLGLTQPSNSTEREYPAPKSPVKTGEIEKETKTVLKGIKVRELSTGSLSGELYYDETNNIKVLVIDDTVEIVETVGNLHKDATSFRGKYGKPLKEIQTLSGSTLLYKDFSADVTEKPFI